MDTNALVTLLAIAHILGKTGINVMTRLIGLILAALAVEVMTDGLRKLFPVLARKLPYKAATSVPKATHQTATH